MSNNRKRRRWTQIEQTPECNTHTHIYKPIQ